MAESNASPGILGRLKELFTVSKEGIIFLVLVILLVRPSYVGWIAEEAGISKAFGLEFYQEIEASQAQTTEAQKTIDKINDDLTQVMAHLQPLRQSSNPEVRQAARKLTTQVDSLQMQGQTVKKSLRSSLETQNKIISRMRKK